MLKYIYQTLMTCSYSIALCIDEKAFEKELRRLRVPGRDWPLFVTGKSDATVHYFENATSGLIAIVCIRRRKGISLIQMHALMVHEAVHIWQAHREAIGEKKPGDESEAYAIQNISQALMQAYQDFTGKRP